LLDDLFGKVKNWLGGKSEGGFNVQVSQNDLKNLAPGKVIIFKHLPELIYNNIIGKSIDIEHLQFEVKLEVRYNEDGFTYKEFKIEDEGMEFWLECIRDMGTWKLSIWKRMPEIGEDVFMKDGKIAETIDYDGETYTLDSDGKMKMEIMDENNPQKGTLAYWIYNCKDDPNKQFVINDFMESGNLECAIGEKIKDKDFEILLFSGSFK